MDIAAIMSGADSDSSSYDMVEEYVWGLLLGLGGGIWSTGNKKYCQQFHCILWKCIRF